MASDKEYKSLTDFLKEHIWAIVVAIAILGMNYGIMTAQIAQIEMEVAELRSTVQSNDVETNVLRRQRAAEIAELNTLMKTIAADHRQYTREIQRLNDQILLMYQNESTGRRQSENRNDYDPNRK